MDSLELLKATEDLDATPLLPAQRRQRIVEFLHRHRAVTLQQLEQALHVSMSTLRRDLDALAADGEVDRTRWAHCSAIRSTAPRARSRSGGRTLSARKTGDRQSCGGGIAAAPERHLRQRQHGARSRPGRCGTNIPLTAVTNNLAIAQVLGTSPLIQVHVFGGLLRHGSNTLTGDALIEGVRAIGVDVLLMGIHAVTEGELTGKPRPRWPQSSARC